jgi:hypothetical protein
MEAGRATSCRRLDAQDKSPALPQECAARPRILARLMGPDGAFARLSQEWIS